MGENGRKRPLEQENLPLNREKEPSTTTYPTEYIDETLMYAQEALRLLDSMKKLHEDGQPDKTCLKLSKTLLYQVELAFQGMIWNLSGRLSLKKTKKDDFPF